MTRLLSAKKKKKGGMCKIVPLPQNSCGGKGCDAQPYIMPYLGKESIPFTTYKQAA